MQITIFDRCRWKLPQAALLAVIFLASCGNRATPASKPQSPPPFEFLGTWGDKGDGPGKLNAPVVIAPDSLGNVFFADPGSGFIHKFESRGTPLFSFEEPRARHATGIAVDSGGAIYLAEAPQGTIFVFLPDGNILQTWRSAPQRHFSGVLGITVDDLGNLYVPDPAAWRVDKIDSYGRQVKFWTATKTLPSDPRPSSVATSSDGSVFVAYAQSGSVTKFNSDGTRIISWSAVENIAPDSPPMTGFAVGGQFVFTMTASSSQIRVWTLDGQHKLDADLSAFLGGTTISAPQIAATPHAELLLFDPSVPKIFRFRLHLDNKEPL
jgi:DNA-binding beta-propeller fold protein YncE